MEKLPLKVLRELEVAAVVQVIDRVEVTSKRGRLYELVRSASDDGEEKDEEA